MNKIVRNALGFAAVLLATTQMSWAVFDSIGFIVDFKENMPLTPADIANLRAFTPEIKEKARSVDELVTHVNTKGTALSKKEIREILVEMLVNSWRLRTENSPEVREEAYIKLLLLANKLEPVIGSKWMGKASLRESLLLVARALVVHAMLPYLLAGDRTGAQAFGAKLTKATTSSVTAEELGGD